MYLYPNEAMPITASATGTTSAITATLPAVAGRTVFLTSIVVTSSGATAAGSSTVTVTGTVGGSLSFVYPQVAIANNNQAPLDVFYEPAVQASSSNTAISATVTLGAGTTAGAVTLTGYMI